jgi:T1SS-143 domain-containing protein
MEKFGGTSLSEVHGTTDFTSNADGTAGSAPESEAQSPQDEQQDAEATIKVAQEATGTQHVATPSAGQQVTIAVVPGVEYDFDFHRGDAEFVFSDGNLVILVHGGGEIILEDFGSDAAANLVPPLDFAGDIIGAFALLSESASSEQLAELEPAAGPGGDPNLAGPASFSPFAPGPLEPGIPEIGPISPTSLAFGAPALTPFVFTALEDDSGPAVGPNETEKVDEDDLHRINREIAPDIILGSTPSFNGNNDQAAGDDLPPNSPTSVGGVLNISYGPSGPGDIVFSTSGPALTSEGHPLVYSWDEGSHTLTAYYLENANEFQIEHDVFKVQVTDVATGDYVFTLLDHLDHAPGGGENNLLFNLDFTVTNGGGHSATGSLPIDVDDDVPVLTQVNSAVAEVDEDDLTTPTASFDGNHDAAPGDFTPNPSPTAVSGSLGVSFGADGPAPDAIGNVALTNNTLASGGHPVSLVEDGGVWFGEIPGGHKVFSLSFDSGAGTFTFTLLDHLDHAPGGDENDLTLGFTFTAKDFDGDTVGSSISVVVNDDMPTFANEETVSPALSVDESHLAVDDTQSFGGLFSPHYGADGPAAVNPIVYGLGISAPAADSGLIDTVSGNHVYLFLNGSGQVEGREGANPGAAAAGPVVFMVSVDASGNVTLDQERAVVHSSPDSPVDSDETTGLSSSDLIKLTATITDGDGDSTTSTVNIGASLTFHDDGPTITAGDTTISHDETAGVQGDADDTATALPAAFSTRLGVLGAGAEIGHAHSAAAAAAVNGGADGVANLSLTNASGTALSAVDSGVTTLNGDHIFLYTDGTDDNIVLGREGSGSSANGAGGIVFALYVDASDNSLWLSQFSAIKNPNTGNPDDSVSINSNLIYVTVTDGDGDKTTTLTSLSVSFQDDGPTAANVAPGALSESLLSGGSADDSNLATPAVTGTLTHSYGTDDPGSVGGLAFGGATDPETSGSVALKSGGVAVTIVTDGTHLYGYAGVDDAAHRVFTLDITDTTTGAYTFTLLKALDHPDAGQTGSSDPLALNFGFTAKDGDGDTANATLTVTVNDDGPTAANVAPGALSESQLVSDADAATPGVSGTLTHNYGADGAGSMGGLSFTNATDPDNGNGLVTLKSGGVNVQIAGSGTSLHGFVGVDDAAHRVFTLNITDTTTGAYTFTLLKPLDHPEAGETGSSDPLALNFGFTAKDSDGDTANATLTVTVNDDGPAAADDVVSVNVSGSVSNNLLTNDGFGADGAGSPAITQVKFGATTFTDASDGTTDGIIHATGNFGNLTLNAGTGAYTYNETVGVVTSQTDVFNYTIKDGDGDTAAAKLTVTVNVPQTATSFVINEIGLRGATGNGNSGDFVEIHNTAGGNAVANGLVFQLDGASTGSVTFNPASLVNIPGGGYLVIKGDGTYAVYNSAGVQQSTGSGLSTWNFNDSNGDGFADTRDKVGVNLQANSTNLDKFVANGSTLVGSTFNAGAGTAPASLTTLLNNAPANAPAAFVNFTTFDGQIGDQMAVLGALHLARPDVTGVAIPAAQASNTDFARVDFSDNDNATDWTTTNGATPGKSNDQSAINPHDANDDFNPTQAVAEVANEGQNTASGGGSNDALAGGGGPDFIMGGAGNDTLGDSDHNIQNNNTPGGAEGHNDFIYGDSGDDQLWGGRGADLLIDVSGKNLLVGGTGDDILIAEAKILNAAAADDTINPNILIGDNITTSTTAHYNFALVIDVSGSMNESFDGSQSGNNVPAGQHRIDLAADAYKALIANIVAQGVGPNTTIEIVPFNNAVANSGPTAPASFTLNAAGVIAADAYLDTLKSNAGGNTQYEPALNTAETWLAAQSPASAVNFLYFISDGADNNGYDPSGSPHSLLYNGTIPNLTIKSFGIAPLNASSDVDPDNLDAVVTGTLVVNHQFDQAIPITSADQVTAVVTSGLALGLPTGSDIIYGGAGSDYIFGDNLVAGTTQTDINNFVGAPFSGTNDINDILANAALVAAMNSDPNGKDDYISGGAGNDIILGEGGNDQLLGDAGNDTIYGGLGNDGLDGGDDSDSLIGGLGDDTAYGDSGAGNDTIWGDNANDTDPAGGNDLLFGGLGNDVIHGEFGNDTIWGDTGDDTNAAGGADSLFGGMGNDVMRGELGNDTMWGDSGDDTNAAGGNDSMFGGLGNDIMHGEFGNDTIWGDKGDDTNAAGGNDLMFGGLGADVMHGELGGDTIWGDNGDDTNTSGGNDSMFGGLGNDVMHGEFGNDTLWGDNGDDTNTSGGNDQLFGGLGNDVLHGELGGDTLWGDKGDDTNTSGGNDQLFGGLGNDVLHGEFGSDTLWGDKGDDTNPSGGNDQLFGGLGNDQLHGEFGNDTLWGDKGDDTNTSGGNDQLFGGMGNDELHGEIGNDTMWGDNGDDTNAAGGNDLLFGGLGNDQLHGEFGNDTLWGDKGDDTNSSGGNDQLFGGLGNDVLHGEVGNDTLWGDLNADTGSGGNDSLFGGDGNDVLHGGGGVDTLDGGAGRDTLFGGDGNDLLIGGAGNDSMTGGAGNDTFSFDLHSLNSSGTNDGADHITDWSKTNSVLQFTHVVNGAGTDLQDLIAAISSISQSGSNTTIGFKDGASVQFDGITGMAHSNATSTSDIQDDLNSLTNNQAAIHILISH